MTLTRLSLALTISLLMISVGCRRVYTFAPVEGTIKRNGQPLSGLQVIFLTDSDSGTEGPRSTGTTDAAGRYRLQTDNGLDGAAVGKHRVCIVELPPPGTFVGRNRRRLSGSELKEPQAFLKNPNSSDSKVPAIYQSINETPLRAKVSPGGIQSIDFDIP